MFVYYKSIWNEKGQTIAAVVLLMIIALGVGITVSARFMKNLRQTTQQDAASRALSISEAAVERILNTDYEILANYIQFNNCGSACTLQIIGSDGLVATANVALSYAGGSSTPFDVGLSEDDTVEISLQGYPSNTNISVCWNNPLSGDLPSITAALVYGMDGNYLQKSYAYNSIGSAYTLNGFSEATSGNGYANCFTVNSNSNPNFLRLRSFYNDVVASVLPTSGATIPSQGIKVVSTGTVLTNQRIITVLITSPHLPQSFDYVLFSKSIDQPLSN